MQCNIPDTGINALNCTEPSTVPTAVASIELAEPKESIDSTAPTSATMAAGAERCAEIDLSHAASALVRLGATSADVEAFVKGAVLQAVHDEVHRLQHLQQQQHVQHRTHYQQQTGDIVSSSLGSSHSAATTVTKPQEASAGDCIVPQSLEQRHFDASLLDFLSRGGSEEAAAQVSTGSAAGISSEGNNSDPTIEPQKPFDFVFSDGGFTVGR